MRRLATTCERSNSCGSIDERIWFALNPTAKKQTSSGIFLHQLVSNSFQFLDRSGPTYSKMLGCPGLIVLINCQRTSEQIMFDSLKIRFHSVTWHKIRNRACRRHWRLANERRRLAQTLLNDFFRNNRRLCCSTLSRDSKDRVQTNFLNKVPQFTDISQPGPGG